MSQTVRFPFEKTIDVVPNDPVFEAMCDALDGLPPARQKRLVMRFFLAGMIDSVMARLLIDVHGLKEI